MGFPLRSNIFKHGTHEQREFASFPIQVAILFSPSDQQFVEAFREVFLHLDQITGEQVAFFAVLDPPQNWISSASERRWWQEYRDRFGQTNFTYDDRVLVKEIARLFKVSWHSLPSIVVGTDLWAGEFITSPTSVWTIERQLEALTQLVREWGRPNIDHIDQVISECSEFADASIQYYPPNDELRHRLGRAYGAMNATSDQSSNKRKYNNYPQEELKAAIKTLDNFRQQSEYLDFPHTDNFLEDTLLVEEILEDIAGQLVIPATVAMRVWQGLQKEASIPLSESLDEESLIMIETALRVGNFLEKSTKSTSNPSDFATRRPSRDQGFNKNDVSSKKSNQYEKVDFTPGAQGIWKAFEREINLSLIQAARASRNVTMPQFFALYDPSRKVQGRVRTGQDNGDRPIYRDINQVDRRDPRLKNHKFLSLGDALFVVRALQNKRTEKFDQTIVDCLGNQLDEYLFRVWKKTCDIRNTSSHVERLAYPDYQKLIEQVLDFNVLNPLMKIKQCLSDA
jgi:hypothetical protein